MVSFADAKNKKQSSLWRLTRYIIVIGIMLVSLGFAINGMDWSQFWTVLRQIRWHYLIPTLLLISCSFLLRGIRWWILLRTEIKLSILDAFWGVCVSYLGNMYLPARSGEILRSLWIGNRSKKTTTFVFSTVIMERIVDALLLIVIFFAFVQFLPYWEHFRGSSQNLSLIALVTLLLFVFSPVVEHPILHLVEPYKRIYHFCSQVFTALHTLHRGDNILWFSLLSIAIMLVEWLGMHSLALALDMAGGWSILFLMSSLGLSSALPSTPGTLGIFQFVAVVVLMPLGVTQETSLAYIFLFQATMYLLATVWGLLGISYLKCGNSLNKQPDRQVKTD